MRIVLLLLFLSITAGCTESKTFSHNINGYAGQWYSLEFTKVSYENNEVPVGTELILSPSTNNEFLLAIYEYSMPPSSRIASIETTINFSNDGTAIFEFENDGWGNSGRGIIELQDNQIIMDIHLNIDNEHFSDMRISGGKRVFLRMEYLDRID